MKLFKNKAQLVSEQGISRRKFLALGLVTAVSGVIPCKTLAAVKDFLLPERTLCFYNLYTDERLEAVYWADGKYIPEALAEINHILRDIRTGKVKTINTNLLDLLFTLQQKLKSNEPFHIISGYRTPKSNAILRKKKKGVARNSLHIYGKAVDIRVPGLSTKAVRRAAIELKGGGVGYYPRSRFVHLDIGSVRYWRG